MGEERENKVYIAHAFSPGMIPGGGKVAIREIDEEDAKKLIDKGFRSAIKKSRIAKMMSWLLGVEIPVDRRIIKLKQGDKLIVLQILGFLDEEVTEIPPYKLYEVDVLESGGDGSE